MKRFVVFGLMFIVLILACNTQTKQSGAATATDSLVNSSGAIADSAYQNGARLIAKNDCLTCHMLDKKSVGPSYYEISAKYPFAEGTIENLTRSIIHGSKGLYGPTAMTPHPNIEYNDAKAMATYILSLKHAPKVEQGEK